MLVLSRKSGESVIIGGNITITIIQAKGDRVRLGIEAPKEVPVHRNEVFQRIKEETELLSRLVEPVSNGEPVMNEHAS